MALRPSCVSLHGCVPSECRPAEFPKFRDPESDEDESNVGKMPPSDSEDDA